MPEALNQAVRTFRAKLNDNSEVLYKVIWQGFADIDTHEDGGPSTWTHPVDDRRCRWNITGYITRRVAVSIAGQDYWNDAISKVFNSDQQGQGSSFLLAGLRSENCNDCQDRRDSDYNNMKSKINGEINARMNSDIPDVESQIKGLSGVVSINPA